MNSSEAVAGAIVCTRADSQNTMPSCAIISPQNSARLRAIVQRPAAAIAATKNATSAVMRESGAHPAIHASAETS